MTRSLVCFATICAASFATCSLNAIAQVDEEPSVSPESTPVASAPKAPQTRTRRGEVFSDLYLGAAVTTDATITLDGVVQEESLLCGAECSSTKSPVGGLRVGWFVHHEPRRPTMAMIKIRQAMHQHCIALCERREPRASWAISSAWRYSVTGVAVQPPLQPGNTRTEVKTKNHDRQGNHMTNLPAA